MKMRRYTKEDVANNKFYQLPKFLFEGEFKKLSSDAKILYSLLRDRHDLSESNDWVNENGEVFLIYTRENMADMLGCSVPTARKAFKQLEKYRLVEDEFQGLNKPNLIYLSVVSLNNTREEKTFQSGAKDSFSQDRKDFSTSKTDVSNTEFKDTKNLLHSGNEDNLHFLKDIENDYIFSYLSIMNTYGYKHKRVNDKNLDYILSGIDVLKDYDVDIEQWEDATHKHFRNLPDSNDGDIIAFLITSKRYFDVDLKDNIDR